MTKPLGPPKSKVTEPWNDRPKQTKRAEKKAFKHRKKTARQLGHKSLARAICELWESTKGSPGQHEIILTHLEGDTKIVTVKILDSSHPKR
jgi:hypothetical protein